MNIYKKLMKTRAEFHKLDIKKSGESKAGKTKSGKVYAGYKYFELSDILAPAIEILDKNGLCPVIEFTETEAIMTVYDCDNDNGQTITFRTPVIMAEVNATDIQKLGATQTYLTRYLYIQLLNVVENDIVERDKSVVESEEKPLINTYEFKLSDKQIKRLYAIAYGAGMTNNSLDESIKKRYRKSAKELTKEEYDHICSSLEEIIEQKKRNE